MIVCRSGLVSGEVNGGRAMRNSVTCMVSPEAKRSHMNVTERSGTISVWYQQCKRLDLGDIRPRSTPATDGNKIRVYERSLVRLQGDELLVISVSRVLRPHPITLRSTAERGRRERPQVHQPPYLCPSNHKGLLPCERNNG